MATGRSSTTFRHVSVHADWSAVESVTVMGFSIRSPKGLPSASTLWMGSGVTVSPFASV